jgi:hypothetical protein
MLAHIFSFIRLEIHHFSAMSTSSEANIYRSKGECPSTKFPKINHKVFNHDHQHKKFQQINKKTD